MNADQPKVQTELTEEPPMAGLSDRMGVSKHSTRIFELEQENARLLRELLLERAARHQMMRDIVDMESRTNLLWQELERTRAILGRLGEGGIRVAQGSSAAEAATVETAQAGEPGAEATGPPAAFSAPPAEVGGCAGCGAKFFSMEAAIEHECGPGDDIVGVAGRGWTGSPTDENGEVRDG
jgi:hypothetical protein